MEPSPLSLRDYLLILRRRKWSFLLPAGLVLAVAVAVAQLWPPTVRSEATILIEDTENVGGHLLVHYPATPLFRSTSRSARMP